MKTIKRIGLSVLALVVCVSGLISCGNSGEETESTAITTISTDTLAPNQKPLPDVNYGGYDFNIIMRNSTEHASDMFAEDNTTDVVAEAVMRRNVYVSEKYGVNFVKQLSSSASDDTDALTVILAGEDAYDLVVCHGRRATTYAINAAAANWYDMPYLNLDCDWWNQSAKDCFTFFDSLYFMTGDISYQGSASTYCQVFNESLLKEKNIELPYEAVKSGEWTFEKFSEIAKQCAAELDGQSGILLNSDTDIMGYCAYAWATPYCATYSAGQKIISQDEGGMPVVTIASETTYDALEKLFGLINSDGAYIEANDAYDDSIKAFLRGRVAFMDTTLNVISNRIRMEEIQYGIVPFPKANANVSNYGAHCAGATNMFVVPQTAKDLERTSVILEALCQQGSQVVVPAYYEKVIEGRVAQNYQTYEMLPIIAASRVYDFGYYSSELGKMSELLHDLGVKGSEESFYQLYNQYSRQANTKLKIIVDAYQSMSSASTPE